MLMILVRISGYAFVVLLPFTALSSVWIARRLDISVGLGVIFFTSFRVGLQFRQSDREVRECPWHRHQRYWLYQSLQLIERLNPWQFHRPILNLGAQLSVVNHELSGWTSKLKSIRCHSVIQWWWIIAYIVISPRWWQVRDDFNDI